MADNQELGPTLLDSGQRSPEAPRDHLLGLTMRSTVLPRGDAIIDQVDYASQLLTPLLGARLAVDKIQDWNRTSDPQAALAALAETDKGEGVTSVFDFALTP